MLKKQLLMTIMQKFLSHRKTDITFFSFKNQTLKKRRLEVILFLEGVSGSWVRFWVIKGGVASQLGIVENPKR